MKTRPVSRSITVGAACLAIPFFFANLSSADPPPNYDIADLLGTMPYPTAWKYEESTPETKDQLTFVEPYGDYNDDGFADFVVGTQGKFQDKVNGYVRLLSGKDGTVLFSFDACRFDGQHAYAWPVAGDINDDGRPDLVIAIPYYDDEDERESRVGSVLVFLTTNGVFGDGCQNALEFEDADVEIESLAHINKEGGQFGYNLALVDLDGNGFKDLVVGEWWHSDGPAVEDRDVGAFYVYSSCELTAPSPMLSVDLDHRIAIGEGCRNEFSLCMDALGDRRVVMGAAQYWKDEMGQMELFGRVYVYKYSGEKCGGIEPDMFVKTSFDEVRVNNPELLPLTEPDDCTGLGFNPTGVPDQDFGHRTAAAGDFDNDGDIDLIVGARNRAKAWLWEYDSCAGTYTQKGADYDDPAPNDGDPDTNGLAFANKVGFIGDIDGDGYDDFTISDSGWHVNPEAPLDKFGRVYVYSGRTADCYTGQVPAIFTITGEQDNAIFGLGSGHVGDINHDGIPDLGISARLFDLPGATDAGVVYGVFTPTEPENDVTVHTGTLVSGRLDELRSSNDMHYVVGSVGNIFGEEMTIIDVLFDITTPNTMIDYLGVTVESRFETIDPTLSGGEAFIKNGSGTFISIGKWTPLSGVDKLEKIFEISDDAYVDGNGQITVRIQHKSVPASFTSYFDKVTLVVSRTPP